MPKCVVLSLHPQPKPRDGLFLQVNLAELDFMPSRWRFKADPGPMFLTDAPRPDVKTGDTSRKVLPVHLLTRLSHEGWVGMGGRGHRQQLRENWGIVMTKTHSWRVAQNGNTESTLSPFALRLWGGNSCEHHRKHKLLLGVGVVLTFCDPLELLSQHLTGVLGSPGD